MKKGEGDEELCLQPVPGNELEAHADELSKAVVLLAATLLHPVLDFCGIRAVGGG
jgi:hypothetical protein